MLSNLKILNPLRWKKSFLLILLAVFFVIWFGFLDTYSVWTRYKLDREKKELIQKTEMLKKKTAELDKKIHNLKKDPSQLVKIAREKYGMRKSNETVFKVKVEK